MKTALRQKATAMRTDGWSYNTIAEALGVSKSTLSNWLRALPYSPNEKVKERIGAARSKSAEIRQQSRLASINRMREAARNELGNLSKRDLWLLGIGLYLGEGSKLHEQSRLINSDPEIIRIAMAWFRESCHVPNENFSLTLHIYPDIDETAAIEY
ncbi:MAG: helix-turn-helix domain-containing protein [Patescibacteria group bacterium]